MKLLEKDIIKFILKKLDKETSLSIIKEIKSNSYNRDFFLSVVAKLKMSTNELVEYEFKKSERKKALAKRLFSNTPVQKMEVGRLENNDIRRFIANDEFINEIIHNNNSKNLNSIHIVYTNEREVKTRITNNYNHTNERKDLVKDFNTIPSSC